MKKIDRTGEKGVNNFGSEMIIIEYRELMEKFDNRIIKDNKSMGGKKINLGELHYVMDKLVEGYSQTEIAKEMGVTQNCIYKKILRIKNTLNRIL